MFTQLLFTIAIVGWLVPTIQSLPVRKNSMDILDEIHTAGERVKELDCQGEKGWARNNSQTKKEGKKKKITLICPIQGNDTNV